MLSSPRSIGPMPRAASIIGRPHWIATACYASLSGRGIRVCKIGLIRSATNSAYFNSGGPVEIKPPGFSLRRPRRRRSVAQASLARWPVSRQASAPQQSGRGRSALNSDHFGRYSNWRGLRGDPTPMQLEPLLQVFGCGGRSRRPLARVPWPSAVAGRLRRSPTLGSHRGDLQGVHV